MKTLVSAICRLATTLTLCAVVHGAPLAAPTLSWLQTVHDFGAFDESLNVVNCVFKAVNTGDEALVVYAVRANCGCTVPRYDKHPVAPGDTLNIYVGYNAVGRPGRFEKAVTVSTNADPAKYTLHIEGTVIGTSETLQTRYPFSNGTLKLRQNHLNFGDVAKGNSRSLYIEGYNRSDHAVTPRVEYAPAYIDVTVKPDTVPPGETFVVSTIFRASACPTWDIVNDSIVLATPDGARMPVTTIGNVFDDFRTRDVDPYAAPALTITPSGIDLGRVAASASGEIIRRTVTLQNTSKAVVKLRRVYTISPGIGVKVKAGEKIKPGKKLKMEVLIDPAVYADEKFIDAKILIITDDPARPRNVVEVLGEMVKQP